MKKSLMIMACLVSGHCNGCQMSERMSSSIESQSRMLFARREIINRVGQEDYSTMVRESFRGEHPQQAMPYKYYELRDGSKCMFVTLDNLSMHDGCDCPVPSPKKKSPSTTITRSTSMDEFDDLCAFSMDCPVPSPKKKTPSPETK